MKLFNMFSGLKPHLEDLQRWITGMVEGIQNRHADLFSAGVVNGLMVQYDSGDIVIGAGVGYVAASTRNEYRKVAGVITPFDIVTKAERIELNNDKTVSITPDIDPQYIYLRHEPIQSEQRQHFMTGESCDVYQDDSYSIQIRNTNDPGSNELLLASVITGPIITDLRIMTQLNVDPRIHARNTDTGTTASEFRVDLGGDNLRVLTEFPVPATPRNVRLVEVRPVGVNVNECSNEYQSSKLAMAAKGGEVSAQAICTWKWGWDDVVGSGQSDSTIDATNLPDLEENELVGTHAWLTGNTTDYIITANTTSDENDCTITVTDLNGEPVNLSGVTINSSNPAIIHCNADEYHVEFRQYADELTPVELLDRRERGFVKQSSSPVPMAYIIRMPIGSLQQCVVLALRGDKPTQSADVGVSDIERIEFTDTLTPAFPIAWDASATITTTPTEHGFVIRINATQDILDAISGFAYGFVSTDVADEVDFTNYLHNPRISMGVLTEIPIEIAQSGTYAVAVRPVISGQYVGQYQRAILTSGGGGYMPNVKTLPAIRIHFDPHNQGLIWSSAAAHVMITKQDGNPLSQSNPAKNVKGQICTVDYNGNDYVYLVRDHYLDATGGSLAQYLELEELIGYGHSQSTIFSTEKTVWYDGKSDTGSHVQKLRHIFRTALPQEIRLRGLSADVTYTDGNETKPGIIRVYQLSASSYAQSMEINAHGVALFEEADLEILHARGELILVVEAYTPEDADANDVAMNLMLTIQYQDKVQHGEFQAVAAAL